MAVHTTLGFFLAALSIRTTCAAASGFDVDIRTRNAPGTTDRDTRMELGQRLAALKKRDDQFQVLNTDSIIHKGWNDAVLLLLDNDDESVTSTEDSRLEITCTKCYINGRATAELKYEDVDIGQIFTETVDNVHDAADNLTDTVAEYVKDCVGDTWEKITRDGFDFDDFDCPTFDVSLEFDVPTVPQASMEFRFDEVELFMQLRTVIAAGSSFTIPLYQSDSDREMLLGSNSDLGLRVYFTVDLLLSVDRTLDMTSGLHLKLEDGVTFTVDMFGDKPSGIVFNDGQFEFLPVTVGGDGAAFKAILRIGAHAGLGVVAPDIFDFTDIGAGVEVAVFADVAELVTDITATPHDEECALSMSQEYSFALGAAAGATVFVEDHTYGVAAETFTPVWYTTMTGLCASKAQTTPTAIPYASTQANGKRDDSDVETLSTKITHIGTLCPRSLSNCPLSQRTTTKYTETRLLTTAIAWPETVLDVVSAFEPFGENVQKMMSSSGLPSSFVPPAPTSTAEGGGDSESSGARCGVDTIVMLGLTCLVAIAALIM